METCTLYRFALNRIGTPILPMRYGNLYVLFIPTYSSTTPILPMRYGNYMVLLEFAAQELTPILPMRYGNVSIFQPLPCIASHSNPTYEVWKQPFAYAILALGLTPILPMRYGNYSCYCLPPYIRGTPILPMRYGN